ncbi:hypothetical protein GCM10020229_47160 [Kitasatospora albolonga]|uniref:hypothetical protein n=1 Tax=Kitasatospora albolonga TaxID=68173 RepID=UPI0031E7C4A0
MLTYYYGLKIDLPYYVGGHFWWYYAEDMIPYATKPLWQTLNTPSSADPTRRSGELRPRSEGRRRDGTSGVR